MRYAPWRVQDYICNVEVLAAEQRKELDRVREEKRDIEKAGPAPQHLSIRGSGIVNSTQRSCRYLR